MEGAWGGEEALFLKFPFSLGGPGIRKISGGSCFKAFLDKLTLLKF
jgi:hypothetical protein